jgi:hypothetical protein
MKHQLEIVQNEAVTANFDVLKIGYAKKNDCHGRKMTRTSVKDA